MRRGFEALVMSWLAVHAAACGGPPLGELATAEVSLTVSAIATDANLAALGDAGAGLGVSRAFMSASAVTLLPCAANIGQVDLGPRGYELVKDPPSTERVTTAVTELCGVRIDIDPLESNAAEGIDASSSLYVEAKDAAGLDVTLSSDSSFSLLLAPEDNASFGDEPLLVGVDVSAWLTKLPAIDDPLQTTKDFNAQLPGAVALYVDSNGNQALDADEQTPLARAAASR